VRSLELLIQGFFSIVNLLFLYCSFYREATKVQIESLGGEFLEVQIEEDGENEAGYSKGLYIFRCDGTVVIKYFFAQL